MSSREEIERAASWVRRNVLMEVSKRGQGELEIEAATIFPIEERKVYEIITHPDNHEIFRGIQRCTHRKVLMNDGKGRQVLEVVNESDWNVLGLAHGSIKSRLVVEQSMSEGWMHFTNPDSSVMLKHLYGQWRVYPLDSSVLRHLISQRRGAGDSISRHEEIIESEGSIVTLYQRFVPSTKLPKVLLGQFQRSAVYQIKQTFEDLIMEAWRQKSGNSMMPPYMSSCMKEIYSVAQRIERVDDPDCALAVLEAASESSGHSHVKSSLLTGKELSSRLMECNDSSDSSDVSGGSMNISSKQEPLSHPLSSIHLDATADEHSAIGNDRSTDSTTTEKKAEDNSWKRYIRRVHSIVDLSLIHI